jgi:uncharacterized protein YjeT (DUF2065 family)
MSTGVFIPLGIVMLLAGLVLLLKPGWVAGATGMRNAEAATYGLRIAGMMLAAFGLILAGFAIAYSASAPIGVAA